MLLSAPAAVSAALFSCHLMRAAPPHKRAFLMVMLMAHKRHGKRARGGARGCRLMSGRTARRPSGARCWARDDGHRRWAAPVFLAAAGACSSRMISAAATMAAIIMRATYCARWGVMTHLVPPACSSSRCLKPCYEGRRTGRRRAANRRRRAAQGRIIMVARPVLAPFYSPRAPMSGAARGAGARLGGPAEPICCCWKEAGARAHGAGVPRWSSPAASEGVVPASAAYLYITFTSAAGGVPPRRTLPPRLCSVVDVGPCAAGPGGRRQDRTATCQPRHRARLLYRACGRSWCLPPAAASA